MKGPTVCACGTEFTQAKTGRPRRHCSDRCKRDASLDAVRSERQDGEAVKVVLSLGAGVQSTALLIASAVGVLPKPDMAVFADPGWERESVYAHLDRLEREVAVPAGIPIRRVSVGNIRDDALNPEKRFASMPLYVRNGDKIGLAKRQCTNEYKVKPISRAVREALGYPHPRPVPRGVFVDQWIGISTDEFHRAKSSYVRYSRHVFPLLDLGWSRDDCIEFLAGHGFPDVAKSSCLGCPFHSDANWLDVRSNPAEWEDVVDFDQRIRRGAARANAAGDELRGSAYLYWKAIPLTDVTFKSGGAMTGGCSPFSCRKDEDDL